MAWLIRMEGWNVTTSSTTSYYFSDRGFRTVLADPLPVTYWDRRIVQPPGLTEELFNNVALTGAGQASYGTILLANEDGALDTFVSVCWDGHVIDIYYTDVEDPVFGDFDLVIKGVIRSLTVGDEVEIEIADRRDLTNVEYQQDRYLGTGGQEGGADWTDVKKPRGLGICLQIEPSLIDEVNNIYALTDDETGIVGGIMAVRDRGALLSGGNNFATYSALVSASLTTVDYATCVDLGVIRLASPADGPVTVDFVGMRFSTNLVSNPSFNSGLTGWNTTGSSFTVSSGRVTKTSVSSSTGNLFQGLATIPGEWYVISGDTLTSTGTLSVRIAGVNVTAISPNRGFAWPFQATTTSTNVGYHMDGAFNGWVEGMSVYKFPARAGDMLEWIVDRYGGLSSTDIEMTDISTLNSTQSAALQYYTPAGDNRSVPDALTDIANSVGAWWGFDTETGKFRVKRFDAPASTADATVVARDIYSIRPRPTDLRLRKQTVTWGKRWRPLSEDEIAAGVTDVTKQSLKTEAYPTVYTYASTETEARVWRDEQLDSLFVYEQPAINEAQRRGLLFGPMRQSFDIELYGDNLEIVPGNTVNVTYPRFGLSSGKNFRVIKTQRDPISRAVTFTVWG